MVTLHLPHSQLCSPGPAQSKEEGWWPAHAHGGGGGDSAQLLPGGGGGGRWLWGLAGRSHRPKDMERKPCSGCPPGVPPAAAVQPRSGCTWLGVAAAASSRGAACWGCKQAVLEGGIRTSRGAAARGAPLQRCRPSGATGGSGSCHQPAAAAGWGCLPRRPAARGSGRCQQPAAEQGGWEGLGLGGCFLFCCSWRAPCVQPRRGCPSGRSPPPAAAAAAANSGQPRSGCPLWCSWLGWAVACPLWGQPRSGCPGGGGQRPLAAAAATSQPRSGCLGVVRGSRLVL